MEKKKKREPGSNSNLASDMKEACNGAVWVKEWVLRGSP